MHEPSLAVGSVELPLNSGSRLRWLSALRRTTRQRRANTLGERRATRAAGGSDRIAAWCDVRERLVPEPSRVRNEAKALSKARHPEPAPRFGQPPRGREAQLSDGDAVAGWIYWHGRRAVAVVTSSTRFTRTFRRGQAGNAIPVRGVRHRSRRTDRGHIVLSGLACLQVSAMCTHVRTVTPRRSSMMYHRAAFGSQRAWHLGWDEIVRTGHGRRGTHAELVTYSHVASPVCRRFLPSLRHHRLSNSKACSTPGISQARI